MYKEILLFPHPLRPAVLLVHFSLTPQIYR